MEEKEQEQELKFPLQFTKCPSCGSTRRIAGGVLEEQKQKGRVSEKANACLIPAQAIIADPTKILLTVPIITAMIDACANCGALYCIFAQVQQAQVSAKAPPAGPGLKGFGFPQSRPGLS